MLLGRKIDSNILTCIKLATCSGAERDNKAIQAGDMPRARGARTRDASHSHKTASVCQDREISSHWIT